MDKSLFQIVFNNYVLKTLIFNNVKLIHQAGSQDEHVEERNIYTWSEVIANPHVMAGNGYLKQLKQYLDDLKSNDKMISKSVTCSIVGNAAKLNNECSLDILKYMIDDFKIPKSYLTDALYHATHVNRLDIIKYLLSIEDASFNIWTCLLDAPKVLADCKSNNIDIFIYLLEELEAITANQVTFSFKLFDAAASAGRIDIIEWLESNRPHYREGNNMYYNAVKYGHVHVLNYLKNENKDDIKNYKHLYKCDIWMRSANHIQVMQWLRDNNIGNCHPKIINDAVKTGKLECVKWLHENMSAGCTAKAMDNAIRYFDILVWLHVNRTEGCTTMAMDYAAIYGLLDVVKWLHENRTEGSKYAMDQAAAGGHMDILQFLHFNQSKGCTKDAMDQAASYGHFDIVRFLHFNRTEGCTVGAMNRAAERGHLDIVSFLHENRTEGCTTFAMDHAASIGRLDIVSFLHYKRTEGCNIYAMNYAASNGHLEVVRFLHENRTEGCTTNALDDAFKNGHMEVAMFLEGNRTEGCTKRAMNQAIDSSDSLKITKYLHDNRTEGCTTIAMDSAASKGHLELVKFLHFNRTEGCTKNAMNYAARYGYLDIVQFLHHNRTEGCTEEAIGGAAAKGHFEIVKWLCENRTEGYKHLELAKDNGHWKIVNYLTNFNKSYNSKKHCGLN